MMRNLHKLFLLSFTLLMCNATYSRDLIASAPELPRNAPSDQEQPLSELLTLMDKTYVEGKITVKRASFQRSIASVEKGLADFHLPLIHNPDLPAAAVNYRPISVAMGKTVFVIYSHVDNPVTRAMIDLAQDQTPFPYTLESNPGHNGLFNFPIARQKDLHQMIRKVEAGRIDGFIYAQERSDRAICKLKASKIHRAHYQNFFDIPIVQIGSHGDEIDKIVSDILNRLKKSGELQAFWSQLHGPYNDWQPSQQDWQNQPQICQQLRRDFD